MFKNLEGARLGIFIFLATTLMVLAIFLIGNKESLFVSTINIQSVFKDVQGLKTGAPVRLSGLDIGSVTDIDLTPDSVGYVIVKMRIDVAVRHLIRLDSEASIETEGLVGKKIIAITPGSSSMDLVRDGGTVNSKQNTSINEIISETQSALGYFNLISKDFAEISARINKGEGTLGKFISDEKLYYSAVDLTRSAAKSLDNITIRLNEITDFVLATGGNVESILKNVDVAVVDIQRLIKDVEAGKGLLGAAIYDQQTYDSIKVLINNLVKTTTYAVSGVEDFSENMEALKHNWLFKGYFEKRGYWDRQDFEKDIDKKIEELRDQTNLLEKKLSELQAAESKK
ncbi:MAG: MlaD family protein [Ignavibacteriales bacterium]|nr:MlaD family protein [Ignavibacteriales bacterium]MCF8305711.1 MlaD family protein [Ignavibacteriales bacterium]MCF8315433.1 MlaD family protein [Ignavibacteriales bacterium]MCF8437039.1 MlaD family protein [Ignavibacteriales bacterium]